MKQVLIIYFSVIFCFNLSKSFSLDSIHSNKYNVNIILPIKSFNIGSFQIFITNSGLKIFSKNKLKWQSIENKSFLHAGIHNLTSKEERGSFIINENIKDICTQQTLNFIKYTNHELTLKGYLSGKNSCETKYKIKFYEKKLGHLSFNINFSNTKINYTGLVYSTETNEHFFGFGEQFSALNLKGLNVPIISQEAGVGRGKPLISEMINLLSPGSSGNITSTYYAVPHYISSFKRSLFLENTEYMVFDLTHPTQVSIKLFHGEMTGRILSGDNYLNLIEQFTEYSGRMHPLPDWVHKGAIIGVQGGTAKVQNIISKLENLKTPMSGVWIQDWVGKRKTKVGSQLWWNWELDQDHYPNWDNLVNRIESNGAKMLCYINPMLVDVNSKRNHKNNYYREALKRGYFVKRQDQSIYQVKNTDFEAGLIDLTHPSAFNWIKDIIKEQLILKNRCYGWMHDFGEALPLDAKLYSGVKALTYHNKYPVDWARVASEAINELNLQNQVIFFTRSGSAKTPTYSPLLWEGDHLVTWDHYDGLHSAIIGMLTSGFSGISLNHSDIGGYTNMTLKGLGYNRSQNLLYRWIELATFTSIFRTHEGLNPEYNAQFYDSEQNYKFFDRFAKIYNSLFFYRKILFHEAHLKGYPVVRHPMLHFSDDKEILGLKDHFLLGSQLLFVPVVKKNQKWVNVYFPNGKTKKWIHLFTGEKFGGQTNDKTPSQIKGIWKRVIAPVGTPAVFFPEGSLVGNKIKDLIGKIIQDTQ